MNGDQVLFSTGFTKTCRQCGMAFVWMRKRGRPAERCNSCKGASAPIRTLTCEHCGAAFARRLPGPPARFCCASHRTRAWEQRKRTLSARS